MSIGTILHVNAVGFPAAIEMNLEQSLRTWPFVIANEEALRAVVIAPVAYSTQRRRAARHGALDGQTHLSKTCGAAATA